MHWSVWWSGPTPSELVSLTRRVRDRRSGSVAERSAGTAQLATTEDTIALGATLGSGLKAGDVVVLSGPLGAGKTVMAKGIAQAMDVDGPVVSPTFVLARVHRARQAGRPAMVHVDMYRLLDHPGVDLVG